MSSRKRFEFSHILKPHIHSLGTQMVQCRIHIKRIPQYQHIGHEPERSQLIFLSLPVPLPELTTASMKSRPGQFRGLFRYGEISNDL